MLHYAHNEIQNHMESLELFKRSLTLAVDHYYQPSDQVLVYR